MSFTISTREHTKLLLKKPFIKTITKHATGRTSTSLMEVFGDTMDTCVQSVQVHHQSKQFLAASCAFVSSLFGGHWVGFLHGWSMRLAPLEQALLLTRSSEVTRCKGYPEDPVLWLSKMT
jgi:hypothetical protein